MIDYKCTVWEKIEVSISHFDKSRIYIVISGIEVGKTTGHEPNAA